MEGNPWTLCWGLSGSPVRVHSLEALESTADIQWVYRGAILFQIIEHLCSTISIVSLASHPHYTKVPGVHGSLVPAHIGCRQEGQVGDKEASAPL